MGRQLLHPIWVYLRTTSIFLHIPLRVSKRDSAGEDTHTVYRPRVLAPKNYSSDERGGYAYMNRLMYHDGNRMGDPSFVHGGAR